MSPYKLWTAKLTQRNLALSPWIALAAVLLSGGCATSTVIPAKPPLGVLPDDKDHAGNSPETATERREFPVHVSGTSPAEGEARPANGKGLQTTIRDPGPDLSNFPNASYTLPEGGVYVEMSPVNFQGASINGPKLWNWEILLRYGLTNSIELRLFTQGLSVQGLPQSTTGFGPLAFDTKIHLAKDDSGLFNYSLGIEAYIQTAWGSPAFSNGTQYSFTLNVDHALPWDIAFNWNLGVLVLKDELGDEIALPTLQWAFQREIAPGFAVFIQGYGNRTALPRVAPSGRVAEDFIRQHTIGAGFQWTVNDRVAVYGSYSAGIGPNPPSYLGSLGFAVAF